MFWKTIKALFAAVLAAVANDVALIVTGKTFGVDYTWRTLAPIGISAAITAVVLYFKTPPSAKAPIDELTPDPNEARIGQNPNSSRSTSNQPKGLF